MTVNPGNTSTKVAVVQVCEDDDDICSEIISERTYRHKDSQMDHFENVLDQLSFRLDVIWSFLCESQTEDGGLDAVAGRGGLARPVPGGTYPTCQVLLDDLRRGVQGEHPANLGGLLAHEVAKRLALPSFIVDPVSVDELTEKARISGLPGIERRSLWHALNCRAAARNAAQQVDKSLDEANLVVVHLGSGITVVAFEQGRAVDLTDPTAEGPFGPDRAGGLPATGVVDLAFSEEYSHAELRKIMMGKGGIYAYLGTRDMPQVVRQAEDGIKKARLFLDAMFYQTSKTVGSMAAVLKGSVDAVVLTGGMANSEHITESISGSVNWIAPVVVLPGEDELKALAEGVWRVLSGREKAAEYPYGMSE